MNSILFCPNWFSQAGHIFPDIASSFSSLSPIIKVIRNFATCDNLFVKWPGTIVDVAIIVVIVQVQCQKENELEMRQCLQYLFWWDKRRVVVLIRQRKIGQARKMLKAGRNDLRDDTSCFQMGKLCKWWKELRRLWNNRACIVEDTVKTYGQSSERELFEVIYDAFVEIKGCPECELCDVWARSKDAADISYKGAMVANKEVANMTPMSL